MRNVEEILHWKPALVALPPDRPNIFIEICRKPRYNIADDLQSILDGLRSDGVNFPKTLIFAQSIGKVMDIVIYFKTELKGQFYADDTKSYKSRVFSVYHGNNEDKTQKFCVEEFVKPDSTLRGVAATVAFGMGIEVPNIRHVIQHGKCSDMVVFWQQAGRAGRDGNPSTFTWFPQSIGDDDKELFTKLKEDTEICLRKTILEYFLLPGMDESALKYLDEREKCTKMCDEDECVCSACMCCTNCRNKCDCVA